MMVHYKVQALKRHIKTKYKVLKIIIIAKGKETDNDGLLTICKETIVI